MKRAFVALLCAASIASPVAATEADSDAARAIEYRKSIYHAIRWNWVPLAEMVQQKRAFDRAEFVRRSTRVSFLAHQLLEGFPPGSHEGAETEALPAIWNDFGDFTAKLDDFKREAHALRTLAATGDEAAIKSQFVKTAGTCKACHDEYRAD